MHEMRFVLVIFSRWVYIYIITAVPYTNMEKGSEIARDFYYKIAHGWASNINNMIPELVTIYWIGDDLIL